MDELKEDIEVLSDAAKRYLKTEMELFKLEAVDHLSSVGATIFSRFIFTILAVVAYALYITALGIYLNEVLHSDYLGILFAAVISTVLLIIAIAIRKRLIEGPMQDVIIRWFSKRMKL